ncbi:MAG TPA: hypothetical protein ENK91_11000 [Bacteroidetes bacterium]|nr:hypothetical protein [Flavobacteriia bacterium]HHH54178.1 hypothetical protein [Bacteroidota bacterium]
MYLKIFIHTGISFGILMAIFNSIQYGFIFGIISGILSGLFFGFFMSLIIGTLHKITTKNNSKEDNKVYQTIKIKLNQSFDEVFDLCLKSLNKLKISKVIKSDFEGKLIQVKTSMSWKSFGEIITFSLIGLNENSTKIIISSKPSLSTTIVDYGKNLENLETIKSFLTKNTVD